MIYKSIFLFFTTLLTVISWHPVSLSAQDSLLPKKLAIYYGYPSLVNGSMGDINAAVDVFSAYDVVVFGDALQFPQFNDEPGQVNDFGCLRNSHDEHDNTLAVINGLKTPPNQTEVYGYVSIGGENTARSCPPDPTPLPLSEQEIKERIDAWYDMGVAGIFLDEAEYGFGASRERQNTIINYVHSKGLRVFINGFNPEEVFGEEEVDEYLYETGYLAGTPSTIKMNPHPGQSTLLGQDDIYLLEHFQIINGDYRNPDDWASRSDKMAAYKEQYGVQVATVTTSANPTEPPLPDCITLFDQEKFDYAWWSTLLYGFDFMSWGEPVFSAWGICQNQLPFHDRPVAGEIGNAFTGPVAHPFPDDPPIYTRTTTAGTIEVDVAAHAGSHTPDSTINQPPIPGDDSINTQQDIPVTMAAADLLANDTDPDNDAPSITGMATTSTQGGAIVSNGDDTYTYTPPAGFSGTDTFTYTISDGKGGSATGNVSITVIPVVPPVAGHTIGLYDPLASAFYLKHSNAPGKADMVYGYGPAGAGWQPVMGDWNNNGVHTPGLYNPLTGTFYLKDTHSGGKADKDFRYGPVGQAWLPLVGDWNGDGTDTVGLYNPATGTFYLKDDHSGGKATYTFRFGPIDSALIPLAGDWNGDGQDTVGLYHQHTGVFYLVNAHRGGKADLSFRYGPANAGWQPLIGDWNGDGTDTIGLCSERSQFYLRHSNTPGVADLSFRYGPADQAWQPLVGKWQ